MFKKGSLLYLSIEGSGKSINQNTYKKLKFSRDVLLTREPGGTKSAEITRKLILKDYFENRKIKFDKYTDTLLYLAARNEHIKNKIFPAYKRKVNYL